MNERKTVQQEIAPYAPGQAGAMPHSVEKKRTAAVFFELTATKRIAFIAMLSAIAVVLKCVSIPLGMVSISFLYLPVYLAGAMFGPLVGMAVGGIGDALGATIQYGSPDPLVTLGNAVMGGIMGLSFLVFKKAKPQYRLIIGAVVALFVCSLGINTVANAITSLLYTPSTGAILLDNGKFTILTWWRALVLPINSPIPRIALQPIMVAVNTAMAIPVYLALQRQFKAKPLIDKEND